MIRLITFSIIVITVIWWLASTLFSNPGHSSITFGTWQVEMKTATLILSILGCYILFYLATWTLLQVLGLRKRFARMKSSRLSGKASRGLTQGLIQLAEGHWDKAEKLLTQYAEHSETPLLNYLTAARAAHMQNDPARRDEWLRHAIESDNKAQVAVGVSQAEMQMSDAQLEQAHATLMNLRKLSPQNSYVLKLYAKTLYRQENWDELLKLLPELLKHQLLNDQSKSMQQVQAGSLQGSFNKHAQRKEVDKLQTLWKKIPQPIKDQPETVKLYANALYKAGADDVCAQFIIASNKQAWNENITDLFGRLYHGGNLAEAIKNAELWLHKYPDNPVNLLLLARLHNQQKLWGIAKSYYETSLNQAPDTEGYLELAELLETMGEQENAEQCYRIGLRYQIRNQGERLVLTAANRPPLKVAGEYQTAPIL